MSLFVNRAYQVGTKSVNLPRVQAYPQNTQFPINPQCECMIHLKPHWSIMLALPTDPVKYTAIDRPCNQDQCPTTTVGPKASTFSIFNS